jgi:hypothetical protein
MWKPDENRRRLARKIPNTKILRFVFVVYSGGSKGWGVGLQPPVVPFKWSSRTPLLKPSTDGGRLLRSNATITF